jgi:uncharacterized damage-inducible protein DinB
MTTIDFIRAGLEASNGLTLGLLDDMKDSPLTQPTSKGGNHPLWVLGHLTYAEANIVSHIIGGDENPLIGWKEMFGMSTDPSTNAADYLPWDEVRQKFDEVHGQTVKFLDGLTDTDLATPTKNCPPGREEMMGTIGGCLLILILHPMMHRGQVADARRMAGRDPLFA